MADTPTVTSSEPRTPPSSAAEQARLRKERREAKIRAGGSARLDKITGLGGGISRDPPPQPPATSTTAAATATTHAADPDEIDISQHHYFPGSRTSRNAASAAQQPALDESALRQMMLGFDTPTPPPGVTPFGIPGSSVPGMPASAGAAGEDPMMAMLQQMLGGDGAGGMNGMPGGPGVGGVEEPYAYIWRIVHALFALGLGLYIALMTPFNGSRTAREGYTSGGDDAGLTLASVHFFWIFATAEVLLQTSRFFVEKGRVQQGTVMRMITGFLPEPYKGYLAMISRYSRIWTTVSADAMALVFVLGACAWWRSV